jgi:hypothetical protein
MKTYNYKTICIAMLLLVAGQFSGCSNFTDIDLPSSQLSSKSVFEDKSTAAAAMTEIYSKIRENGLLTGYRTGLSSQLGMYADELQYYGQSGTAQANFYNNALLASSSEITELWRSSYKQIYEANSVLEGVEKSISLSPADKSQLNGEAFFVRGLIHFYLLNCFGPVPYITGTDYMKNSTVGRLSESEVYSLIKKDIQLAVEFLPADYIGSERVRPNKGAAQALLARVCLYMELWDEASNNASAVLNQTSLFVWPSSNEGVFLKDSASTIWQLSPALAGSNTYEGNNFIFLQGPPPFASISTNLVNAFSNEDLRKKNWLKAVVDGTSMWYHAYKYKKQSAVGASSEYSIVLRMAEQYLIRAESRAHSGDLIGAKEDLNKIRNLAGLPDTTAETAKQLIDAVIDERRLEFFTEHGHRFFDLKRTGRIDQVLSSVKLQWKSYGRYMPLPQSELLLNPNLTQNAEY